LRAHAFQLAVLLARELVARYARRRRQAPGDERGADRRGGAGDPEVAAAEEEIAHAAPDVRGVHLHLEQRTRPHATTPPAGSSARNRPSFAECARARRSCCHTGSPPATTLPLVK